LAKLPKPTLMPVQIAPLVKRIVALETRLACTVREGPPITIRADADQLEQVLINLIRNGVEASSMDGGGREVEVGWNLDPVGKAVPMVELWVKDRGPGIANPGNLFVPFFTTKQGGSGIGLVLSRQIVEAHGGMLRLVNRVDGPGAEALLSLPA
jgi:signal transduction histidine kinase